MTSETFKIRSAPSVATGHGIETDGGPQTFRTPDGAWDCHAHVFEREDEFPFSPRRTFKPGQASLEMLRDFRRGLGLAHTVVVQASVYGADNRLLLEVLRREAGAARGVAVIDDTHTDHDLQAMQAVGVRGVRLNLETFGEHDPTAARQRLQALAARVAPLGWHVQLYCGLGLLPALADTLATMPCAAVLDHFACLNAALGSDQPGFDALCDLLRGGNVWLKLSAPSRVSSAAGHHDLLPLAKTLVAAGPARVVWGSDWPHTGGAAKALRAPDAVEPFASIDDRYNAWELNSWLAVEQRRALWVDNPAMLYR